MNKVSHFFNDLLASEAGVAALSSVRKPESKEEAIQAYVEVAAKLGVELTADEIRDFLASVTVEPNVTGVLDENELELVAGGNDYDNCRSTYIASESCYFEDHCSVLVNWYTNHLKTECLHTYKDFENCWSNDACDITYYHYKDYKPTSDCFAFAL